MEVAGATILIILIASGIHITYSVNTNPGKHEEHSTSFQSFHDDNNILALLEEYATTESVKLTERIRGNEALLILQENPTESTTSHRFRRGEISKRNPLEDSEKSNSPGDDGGDGTLSQDSAMDDSGSSSSGVSVGSGFAESGSGEDNDTSTAADLFREWLNEELQRMTTVIYDCKDGNEIIGEWENETIGKWLVERSQSHTQDSNINSIDIGSAESLTLTINGRRKRFLFGEDDREFVTHSQEFPECAIARVSTGCTAFFIGPYHALTAAHCVNNFRYGWRGKIKMWRERNCHNEGIRSVCSRVFAVLGHTHLKMYEYDYALVEMDRNHDPAPCWFGIGYINPWEYPSDIDLEVLGYPYDKRWYTGQPECSYEAMWHASCNVSYSIRQHLLQWCDATSGNSGSPVYSDTDGNKIVYGIHAQSVGNYVYNDAGERDLEQLWNQGPMITPLRYHQILRWMDLP